MKMDSLKALVATVAPTVATALGGPLAGVATRAIAGVLLGRDDATLEEVEAALASATPGDLVKLKELEFNFRAEMEQAGIELERIATDDRASARLRQARMKDWTPSVLGVVILLGFFGTLGWLFWFGLPASGGEVLLIMVGALSALVTQVANFFFGSSAGSKAKDGIIADLKGALK